MKGLPVTIKVVLKFQLASLTVDQDITVFPEAVLMEIFVQVEILFEL